MNLLIIGNDLQRQLLNTGFAGREVHIDWSNDINLVGKNRQYDGCIDLLFENRTERVDWLKEIEIPVVIVNSVIEKLDEIPGDFVRINGWHTFLERAVIEASGTDKTTKDKTELIFSFFGKKAEWVPDITGFITPRVIAAVINEAFISLEENISSKEEIDTAMKLGTNYPYGPFEWGEKIGLKNVHTLLTRLAMEEKRYNPAALLIKEAMA